MKYIIQLPRSGRYVVDAPPTGFKSTLNQTKATRFDSVKEAMAFMKDRGIFGGDVKPEPFPGGRSVKAEFVVLIWDWKDTLDTDELNEALAKFRNPRVNYATTDGDWFALVVTEAKDVARAQEFYRSFEKEMSR